jgi:hypothetical protein
MNWKKLIPSMDEKDKRRTAELIKKWYADSTQQIGRDKFLTFVDHVYPGYQVGPHHRRLARIFEEIAEGKKKRVIVNIAPRHGKSELISYLAPAWFLGKYPHKKIIMASHTADLAVNFGRRVRNLVGSDAYKDIFPQVELQSDSKSASRWGTNFQWRILSQLVWVALSLDGVLTYLLLMILTRSKMPKREDPMFSCLLGSGSSLVQFSVLCPAVQLLLS